MLTEASDYDTLYRDFRWDIPQGPGMIDKHVVVWYDMNEEGKWISRLPGTRCRT